MSRHAEGPLQENVEDIIARYRNERRDLFDRFQPERDDTSHGVRICYISVCKNHKKFIEQCVTHPSSDASTMVDTVELQWI